MDNHIIFFSLFEHMNSGMYFQMYVKVFPQL